MRICGAIVSSLAPDMIQLHGTESPARVREVAALCRCPVIKAIAVETREDARLAREYEDTGALILFDAKPPRDQADPLPGGNGIAFDWQALVDADIKTPYILSGGLTPQNVAAAIELTGATIVDVSSGVENSPGEKDPMRISQFIRNAKSARVRYQT